MYCPSCGQPDAPNQCRTCGVMSCSEHSTECRVCLGFTCDRHGRDDSCDTCGRLVKAFVHGLGFTDRGAVKAARIAVADNPNVIEFDYRSESRRNSMDELLYERRSGGTVIGLYAYPRTGIRMAMPMCWTCNDCGASNGNIGVPCHGCGSPGNRVTVPAQ